ncbi:MAG: dephospho-CoA kinase [Clostridia bacterium]|nr:dephospho-CoA kinase [Clostridia bacterium]
MKIIGLTGQSGSGKSEVARVLLRHDIPHIDCDRVYHDILASDVNCKEELVQEFGSQILDIGGDIHRKKLAEEVFGTSGNHDKLNKLNKITHKYVTAKCEELIKKYRGEGKKAVTLDAPTLIESGLNRKCDVIIAVTAHENTRLRRIKARDNITQKKAEMRINAQPKQYFYTDAADYVIKNDSSSEDLTLQTEKFIREILN